MFSYVVDCLHFVCRCANANANSIANIHVCRCPFSKGKVTTYSPLYPFIRRIFSLLLSCVSLFLCFIFYSPSLMMSVPMSMCQCWCWEVLPSSLNVNLWLIHPLIHPFGGIFPWCSLVCLLSSISFSGVSSVTNMRMFQCHFFPNVK